MKNPILLPMLILLVSALSFGCATMKTWPDYETAANSKLIGIQEKIGGGLKTGALNPDQAQAFLTKLKFVRTDYEALRNKSVYQEDWHNLNSRIDGLDNEVNQALAQTTGTEGPNSGDRILSLQKQIDDGRISRRLPLAEEQGFQARLDSIRGDYLRGTDGGRVPTAAERADISRRLSVLESDLNRFR